MEINISNLIEYFEDRLRLLDLRRNVNHPGKQPEFPMLVFFLGDAAIDGYSDISSRLFQLWPSYKDVLSFIGIKGTKGSIEYIRLSLKHGNIEQSKLEECEFQELVSSLSDKENHFPCCDKRLIYYILNTAEITDGPEYMEWMNIYSELKEQVSKILKRDSPSEFFMLMLDERKRLQQTAAEQVRKYIAGEEHVIPRMLILSNRDSDTATTADWASCYAIIANMIALMNNCDGAIFNTIFRRESCTATVSYRCERKPTKEIGWVAATQMLERLERIRSKTTADNPFQDSNIYDRLGLSKERTFRILDSYAEENLFQRLPEKGQLELFPRSEDIDVDIDAYSAAEFNEITMNSWQRYLDGLMKEAEAKVESDPLLTEQWRKQYEEHIKNSFTVDELVVLSEHPENIAHIFKGSGNYPKDTDILGCARQEIKSRLSSNGKAFDTFTNVIKTCGDTAKESLDIWGPLLESITSVHPVRDKSIIDFYKRRIANYFDTREASIAKEIKEITDMKKMDGFLKKTIDEIIDSDLNIFLASFDEERAERLRTEKDRAIDSNRAIQDNLTDKLKTPKYLDYSFSFGMPIASAIMLKFGTQLEAYMKKNLKDAPYYYNTGNSNSAEFIEVYEIERELL